MQDFLENKKETDTQISSEKALKKLKCGKPYSLKIERTVWRKITKSILQYGVKKSK